MSELLIITLEQQIASVEREIALRISAYPRFVAEHRMRQDKADHEIAAMRAVLTTLKKALLALPYPPARVGRRGEGWLT